MPSQEQLERRRADIEERIDNLHEWTHRFTAVVGIGLILELYEPVVLLIHKFDWTVLFEIIGTLFVVAGVWGELMIEFRAHRKEHELRGVNTDIENSFRQRVAELQLEIERLREKNVETELLLSYRSVGEMAQLEEAMRAFSGTKYAIEFVADEREAIDVQWRLGIALNRAGWVAVRQPGRRFNLGFGICILTVGNQNARSSSKAAEALADWLDAKETAAITMVVQRDDLDLGTAVIEVGPKPDTIEQQRQIKSTRAEQRKGR